MRDRRTRATARPYFLPVGLVVVVLGVYSPVLQFEFLDWDDGPDIYQNQFVTSPGGYREAWRSWRSPAFHPITFLTFHVEWQASDGNPAVFHANNVLLHAANALGVGLLGQAIGMAPGPAWAAAWLWALHPVQVGTVAWIAERKNVLFVVFYIAALLTYARGIDATRGQRSGLRGLSLLFAALSLGSKATAVTLPAALLMLRWARGERPGLKLVRSLWPYVALCALVGVTHLYREHVIPVGGLDIVTRCLIAARAIWTYVGIFLWPVDLMPIYPRWEFTDGVAWGWTSVVALVVTGAVLAWNARRLSRASWFGLGHFLVNASLIVGIVAFPYMQFSFVADYLIYFPSIGLAFLVAAGGHAIARRAGRPCLATGASAVVVSVLAALTWHHVWGYRDSETLWETTIAKNPAAWVAHLNLGVLEVERGRRGEAIEHYRRAIAVNPTGSAIHANLGNALVAEGDLRGAISSYQQAVELDPSDWTTRLLLASCLVDEGELEAALSHLQAAVSAAPEEPRAVALLAEVSSDLGHHAAAAAAFRRAAVLEPDNVATRYGLATELAAIGRTGEAIQAYRAVLEREPDHVSARIGLAAALDRRGSHGRNDAPTDPRSP